MRTNRRKRETGTREKGIRRVTLIGSGVNLALVLGKLMAGWTAGSAAMIADGIHSLSDFATDIVVLFMVHLAAKPQDQDHDYGHGKYETLATALVGILLLAVGAGICWNGLTDIYKALSGEQLPEPGWIALWAALVSIVSKEALYHYTLQQGKQLRSGAVIANAWHHRSDALSSIGTALGIGGAILLGEKMRVLDPLAAVVVSLLIVKVSIELLTPSIDELLEKSLPADVEQKIVKVILQQPGVSQPHHLRTRRIGSYYAIEVHVRMDGRIPLREAHQAATDIEHRLKELFGQETHVGIHVEPEKNNSATGCTGRSEAEAAVIAHNS